MALPVTDNLVLHLDADSITGLNDNDTVETWSDLSGQENDATASGAPTYKTSVLNGKAVVRFDGTDDYFQVVDDPSLDGMDSQDIFILFNPAGLSDYDGIIEKDHWGASYKTHTGEGGGLWWGHSVTDRLAITSGAVNEGIAQLLNLRFTGTHWQAYRDGNSIGSTSSIIESIPSTNTSTYIAVNRRGGTTPYFYLQTDIAEVLIYNRALSTAEREEVEQYLGVKWLGWEAEPEGGSEAEMVISAEGQGQKSTSGSSEATTNITAEGIGVKQASGSSEATTSITSEGQGQKQTAGSVEAETNILTEGQGTKRGKGSGNATVAIFTEGSGGLFVQRINFARPLISRSLPGRPRPQRALPPRRWVKR